MRKGTALALVAPSHVRRAVDEACKACFLLGFNIFLADGVHDGEKWIENRDELNASSERFMQARSKCAEVFRNELLSPSRWERFKELWARMGSKDEPKLIS